MNFKILKLIMLVLLFLIEPISDIYFGYSLYSQTNRNKSSKNKKVRSKKKSSKKNKRTNKKKKTRKKKKTSRKKKSSKTSSKIVADTFVPINKGPKINISQFADELFSITNQLASSNRKMNNATKYMYASYSGKKTDILNRKTFRTTGDYELEAKNNPDNLYYQRQLGLHYESIQNLDKAKDVYLRLASKRPADPNSHFYLGSFFASTGEYLKAKHSFEEALQLEPDHKGTIDAMAMYNRTPGEVLLSNNILKMSSERVPDGAAQKITKIKSLMVDLKYSQALRESTEANRKFPLNHSFINLIGECHLSLNNIEKAKSTFQKSIKLNSKNKSPHLHLANIYYEEGKFIYAALSFSDVVFLDPEDLDARYYQGLSYFKAQEWGRAALSWEDLLRYSPKHEIVLVMLPQAYYIMAMEYNRLGNSSMGRQSFQNAMSINSDTRQWLMSSLITMGDYYRIKRLFGKSLSSYKEVIEIQPNNAQAYLGLGLTYWDMKEEKMAQSSWEKSLSIKPDNNESKGWLIVLQQKS